MLSQALLRIYKWIASSRPHRCLQSSSCDGTTSPGTPGLGAWDHDVRLKAQRRRRSLPAGMSRGGHPEARAGAGSHLAGLRLCEWCWALIVLVDSLGCWFWVGACVLLITQVSRVDSWSVRNADDTYCLMSQRITGREELRVGAKLSLNNWQQDTWHGLFFPCYCCRQRKSLRFPLISALHVSHLWVTAMTGKQEPWMVQITGDDRYPMQLRGFSEESITHTGRSAVEMSNSLS